MSPGTDPGSTSRMEGEAYARALLDRIAAGASSPDDLAALMQFLHSGAMLHGACAVIVAALHRASHAIGGQR